MVDPIRLTMGYEPEWLKPYPSREATAPDSIVQTPSSYSKYATLSYDLKARTWSVIGPAVEGLDTLVTTPLGVMGVPVNWRGRLNAPGYQIPYDLRKVEDNAVYLLRGSKWDRISAAGPSPQYLYEMTSLAFDTKRNQPKRLPMPHIKRWHRHKARTRWVIHQVTDIQRNKFE